MMSERSGAVAEPSCRSRACEKPAAGLSPLTGVALCSTHLDRDIAKVLEQKARLVERLLLLREPAVRKQLRLEQQMLAAEIQEVEEMFDALQEKVQQWRVRTMSRVQAMHDSVARRQKDAVEAEECEKEVSVACDAGDMRKVVELTATLEHWVDEASERSVEFDRDRSEHRKRQSSDSSNLRLVGDVAGGVQQLQFMIDRHMAEVMQQYWLEKVRNSKASPVCEEFKSIDGLECKPYEVTCCTSSDGFFGDASGRVVKTSSNELAVPLPQPCIFVYLGKGRAEHLLVTSVDGAVKLKCHSKLDWNEWIHGLHCDSNRQLLFVAQPLSVTVMDLSGHVMRVINATSLDQPIENISAICGNSDKVFLLESAQYKVFGISKETGDIELSLDLSSLKFERPIGLAMYGKKFIINDSDTKRIYKVCGITGQLIASFLNQVAKFKTPYQVAVEARGIMFVSEETGHTVRAVSASGEILQTLGVPGTAGNSEGLLNAPCALSLFADDDRQLLVVGEHENRRLRIYKIVQC